MASILPSPPGLTTVQKFNQDSHQKSVFRKNELTMIDGGVHYIRPEVAIIVSSMFLTNLDFHKLGEDLEQFVLLEHLHTRGASVFLFLGQQCWNDIHCFISQVWFYRDVIHGVGIGRLKETDSCLLLDVSGCGHGQASIDCLSPHTRLYQQGHMTTKGNAGLWHRLCYRLRYGCCCHGYMFPPSK